jgi:ParB/RepB/Spo0J family partition protein
MASLTSIDGVHKSTSYIVDNPKLIQVLRGFNARTTFKGIDALAEWIDTDGLLTPLWVRRDRANEEQPFILIDGERRMRALRQLFKKDPKRDERIPVLIFDVNEEQALDLMAKANLQREDFTLAERIQLVQRYLTRKVPQKEVGERVGRSKSWVNQMIVLNGASPKVRKAVDDDRLSIGGALIIARKKKLADQEATLKEVLRVAGGKKEKTARAAATVTRTAMRPKKQELMKVVGALETKSIEVDNIDPASARQLVLMALSYAAGEGDRDDLLNACADVLKLAKPDEETAPEPQADGESVFADPESVLDPLEAEEARQAADSKKPKDATTRTGEAAASLLESAGEDEDD